jgi:hypothetical protein
MQTASVILRLRGAEEGEDGVGASTRGSPAEMFANNYMCTPLARENFTQVKTFSVGQRADGKTEAIHGGHSIMELPENIWPSLHGVLWKTKHRSTYIRVQLLLLQEPPPHVSSKFYTPHISSRRRTIIKSSSFHYSPGLLQVYPCNSIYTQYVCVSPVARYSGQRPASLGPEPR